MQTAPHPPFHPSAHLGHVKRLRACLRARLDELQGELDDCPAPARDCLKHLQRRDRQHFKQLSAVCH